MKRGKRYVEAAKLVDRATLYDAADALAIVKKAAVANYSSTVIPILLAVPAIMLIADSTLAAFKSGIFNSAIF